MAEANADVGGDGRGAQKLILKKNSGELKLILTL